MDVACGPGWYSRFMARMSYETYGFDIAADFVEMTKRRISEDQYVKASEVWLDDRPASLSQPDLGARKSEAAAG